MHYSGLDLLIYLTGYKNGTGYLARTNILKTMPDSEAVTYLDRAQYLIEENQKQLRLLNLHMKNGNFDRNEFQRLHSNLRDVCLEWLSLFFVNV